MILVVKSFGRFLLQMQLVAILLLFSLHVSSQITQPFGINLCGPEFGFDHLPGLYGKHFIYPYQSVDYLAQKGFKLVSIPFRWERMQPRLMGPLEKEELQRMNRFLDLCHSKGIAVLISMQNFGRYKINNIENVIGGNLIKREHYNDVWIKLADAFKDKPNIYGFDIMNEPHHMNGEYSWREIAQSAILAIRKVNMKHDIFINGESYSNSEDWEAYSHDLHELTDPANKLVYEAHCYFDHDHTGGYSTHGDGVVAFDDSKHTPKQVMEPFVNWLKVHHKRGFVGEYGVPNNDPRWLGFLDEFLKYLTENGINGTYWAAGPWWHDYPLSVEPKNGKDRPQMKILEKYKFVQQR